MMKIMKTYFRNAAGLIMLLLGVFAIDCSTESISSPTKIKEWGASFSVNLCLLRGEKGENFKVVDKISTELTWNREKDDTHMGSGYVIGRPYEFSISLNIEDPELKERVGFSCYGKLCGKKFEEYFYNVKWEDEVCLNRPFVIGDDLWLLIGTIQPIRLKKDKPDSSDDSTPNLGNSGDSTPNSKK